MAANANCVGTHRQQLMNKDSESGRPILQFKMLEETIQKLRDYVEHAGNPKPNSRLAYAVGSDNIRIVKPLTKPQFKQFTNEANAILNSLSNSEAATDNERETRDILRSLWDQYNHPDTIVTRIDKFNFIAWWIRLCRLERHKTKSSSSLLIENVLNREVDDHISKLKVLSEEFKEKALELESNSPTWEEVFEVYKLLNFLDSESDVPPQVLSEHQASQLLKYLTTCEAHSSRVVERISLIQGRVPLLRNLIMSVKLKEFWQTLASLSRAEILEGIRQRKMALQSAMPNESLNSVVHQFVSVAIASPFVDETYYFHALVHFSRPFGYLQRREGDVISGFYRDKLENFANVLERHSVSKMRGLCSTIVNLRGENSDHATLPFGYLYNLENVFSRISMFGSGQSSYGTDIVTALRDKTQMVRECAAGEMHAFCQNVGNEMNSRYAFKYGERYYKRIGFIASMDRVDVMLNVVGYPDVSADEVEVESENLKSKNSPQTIVEDDSAKLYKRFQEKYRNIVADPDWKTLEPYVGMAASWILAEMSQMNGRLTYPGKGFLTLPVFVKRFLSAGTSEKIYSGRKLGQYDLYLICRRIVLAKAGVADSGAAFAPVIGFAKLDAGGKVEPRSGAAAQFLATIGLTFTFAKNPLLESKGGRFKPEELAWLKTISAP